MEYGIKLLYSDRDALKQEYPPARIADNGTQSPTHLSEIIKRERSYPPRVSSAVGTKRIPWRGMILRIHDLLSYVSR